MMDKIPFGVSCFFAGVAVTFAAGGHWQAGLGMAIAAGCVFLAGRYMAKH